MSCAALSYYIKNQLWHKCQLILSWCHTDKLLSDRISTFLESSGWLLFNVRDDHCRQTIWGPAFGLTHENQLINLHLSPALVSCINYVIQKGYDNIGSNHFWREVGNVAPPGQGRCPQREPLSLITTNPCCSPAVLLSGCRGW